MDVLYFLLLCLLFFPSLSHSSPPYTITKGQSLSPEKTRDTLISKNGVFTAGFHQVGENSFCFSIWFTSKNDTIVWMANRDKPVNGKFSILSLQKSGNLVLKDAGINPIWSTNTISKTLVHLQLNDSGNLVLATSDGLSLWQSFDSPTDTLLPDQPLASNTRLASSTSQSNHSSGFYKLFFNDDNLLSLIFNGLETDSVYWPDSNALPWEVGRSSYNDSKIALLDSFGYFQSSDELNFTSADFGIGPQRRFVLDSDGNIRVYSLDDKERIWNVQWQAFSQPCQIYGICGQNSLCSYDSDGRRCSCLPGYKMINDKDWSQGCELPELKTCDVNGNKDEEFVTLSHVEFNGDDSDDYVNYTFDACRNECLNICSCIAFQYKFDNDLSYYVCNTKSLLLNGYQSSSANHSMYVKLPKSVKATSESYLKCSPNEVLQLDRVYKKKHENRSVKFIFWFTLAFGGFEIFCVVFYKYKSRQPSSGNAALQNYHQVATGFKRFSYSELRKASRNFSEEIGRGGGGAVYKAMLSDQRLAAIKQLDDAEQGEAEFLAEVRIIGRLNHMNLIEIWGYCAEGKHRLLVYEYMEHGSLAENLRSNALNWDQRYEIAVGTAKGLAYLHDECLEWVLHCDVKPENVLLDSDFQPKVADFGLSKLLKREAIGNLSFSKIRGTRGYMAPEWVYNLAITSKVDVYSYGIVILEMITGRPPTGLNNSGDDGSGGGAVGHRGLVSWVRGQMKRGGGSEKRVWIEEIVDPRMNGEYDMERMEVLVKVAMKCAEDDKESRPAMSWVVDMLLHQDNIGNEDDHEKWLD